MKTRLSQRWQRFLAWLRRKLRRPGMIRLLIGILKVAILALRLKNLLRGS